MIPCFLSFSVAMVVVMDLESPQQWLKAKYCCRSLFVTYRLTFESVEGPT
jgi:hypothetical protein